MKKIFSKMLGVMIAVVCILCVIPATQIKATTDISGGYASKATAYNWGTYADGKTVFITLPTGQNDMWVKFTVPTQNHIYARCSYSSEYEGMYTELYNSTSTSAIGKECSPDNIITYKNLQFLALNCDNTTASTQTYYIYVKRGAYQGNMCFSYMLSNRMKTGHGRFSFSGTAKNAGNSGNSLSGVDSSVLSLNLTSNTSIPPNAIVTEVTTLGTQYPSQVSVHHMILPSTYGDWYTSKVASNTSGMYNISINNNLQARQTWQFKYNVLASARSTVSGVSMLLYWEYDIADTNYITY